MSSRTAREQLQIALELITIKAKKMGQRKFQIYVDVEDIIDSNNGSLPEIVIRIPGPDFGIRSPIATTLARISGPLKCAHIDYNALKTNFSVPISFNIQETCWSSKIQKQRQRLAGLANKLTVRNPALFKLSNPDDVRKITGNKFIKNCRNYHKDVLKELGIQDYIDSYSLELSFRRRGNSVENFVIQLGKHCTTKTLACHCPIYC